MAYYNTCPNCGSNLDPGEKCDCGSEVAERERIFIESTRTNPITGQMSFDWDGKESGNETEITNKRRSSRRTAGHFGEDFREQLCS